MTERREWLIRCEFENDELAVCSVEVERGQVGVFCPDHTHFYLSLDQVQEFAEAVQHATAVAERDNAALRERRTTLTLERSDPPSGTP